jgi:predicted lipoprotein with Yx(FWY)xxD motif
MLPATASIWPICLLSAPSSDRTQGIGFQLGAFRKTDLSLLRLALVCIQSSCVGCIWLRGVMSSRVGTRIHFPDGRRRVMSVRVRFLVLGIAATAAVLAGLVAAPGSTRAASEVAARVSVRSTEYGKALFGPSGKVLYVFSVDRGSKSNCYGVCAAAWPPLLTTARPLAGAGVEAKLLGMTKRKDGRLQVTYNGHPLYYYSADKIGKVMCQHANMHGGLWLIIKPNGQVNMAKGKMHM